MKNKIKKWLNIKTIDIKSTYTKNNYTGELVLDDSMTQQEINGGLINDIQSMKNFVSNQIDPVDNRLNDALEKFDALLDYLKLEIKTKFTPVQPSKSEYKIIKKK